MKRTRRTVLRTTGIATAAGLTGLASTAAADETESTATSGMYAPYHLLGMSDPIEEARNASLGHIKLAFVEGRSDGSPQWTDGGAIGSKTALVDELRNVGVTPIPSVGGWNTPTMSAYAGSAQELKSSYEEIIDSNDFGWIDIDDEDSQNDPFMRNEALAMLQEARPDLDISYTVPANPSGVTNTSYVPAVDMVEDAVERGIDITYVNPMVMDFQPTTAQRIIDSMESTHSWLSGLYPNATDAEIWGMLSICPMFGKQNRNAGDDFFYPGEAQTLAEWAVDRNLAGLTGWSINRDHPGSDGEVSPNHCGISDVEPYAFSDAFGQITGSNPGNPVNPGDPGNPDEPEEPGEPGDPSEPEYPQWDPNTVYTSGDRVVYDGTVWEAQWWTRGNEPGASEWGPWDRVEG